MSPGAASEDPRLRAAMKGFDRVPQTSLLGCFVGCSATGCDASKEIPSADLLSVHQITELLNAAGWSWDPIQCPAHNPAFQKRFEVAREAIAEATQDGLRLLVLASGVTLDEFKKQFPKIHDEMTRKAASAAVRALMSDT